MTRFGERKTWKRFVYSRGAIVVLIAALIFVARATYSVYTKQREALARATEAHEELTHIEDRENFLSAEIARLATPRGVEEELRKKFGVAKEGEKLVVITDSSKPAPPPPEKKSFWQKINPLNLFR